MYKNRVLKPLRLILMVTNGSLKGFLLRLLVLVLKCLYHLLMGHLLVMVGG